MQTLAPAPFLKAAHQTAQHFGFSQLETLERPAERWESPRATRTTVADRKLDGAGGLVTSGMSTYFTRGLHAGQPRLFYTTSVLPRSGEIAVSLSVAGVNKSIGEALLIQVLRSLLTDLGYPRHAVRVNSLGDADSAARYTRELTNFFRKRLDELSPAAREFMKEDTLAALAQLITEGHELVGRSPSPLEYLSDASRKHFREIVEHLDMTETPYEIDPRLLADSRCYADALFSIELLDEQGAPVADSPLSVRGGRVDAFTRNILKVDASGAGAVVILKNRRVPTRLPRPQAVCVPSIFMVQLGFGPKIRSLMLLSSLKREGISAYQALASDSLSEQLRQAEALGVDHALILGQKEYVENNVILRDMRSRSQECIPFDTLIPRLKRVARVG